MTTAILSFFAVVIGASLQYIFTRYLENQRYRREQRTKAYLDFLKTASEQERSTLPPDSPGFALLTAQLLDARYRVCLYGSEKAIHAFAVFQELGSNTATPEQRAAWVGMMAAMRDDTGDTSSLETQGDMKMVLMGSRD
jgi:hypothetical protein